MVKSELTLEKLQKLAKKNGIKYTGLKKASLLAKLRKEGVVTKAGKASKSRRKSRKASKSRRKARKARKSRKSRKSRKPRKSRKSRRKSRKSRKGSRMDHDGKHQMLSSYGGKSMMKSHDDM